MKRVLTIAGSDSGGGAGIQADLKTFCVFGVYGMTALTAVTAQNTRAVKQVFALSPELVRNQIEAVFDDIGVDAVKTGMLVNQDIIETVADCVRSHRIGPLVVDPVMVSKSGMHLLRKDAVIALQHTLLPLAFLVTPNLEEAAVLTGMKVRTVKDMEQACRLLFQQGVANVLVKGGHLPGEELVDILFDGDSFTVFPGKRIPTRNTHGTGCTYSAALCSLFALGYELIEAVSLARRYLEIVITHSLDIGHGFGPTNHLAPLMLRSGVDPATGGKLW